MLLSSPSADVTRISHILAYRIPEIFGFPVFLFAFLQSFNGQFRTHGAVRRVCSTQNLVLVYSMADSLLIWIPEARKVSDPIHGILVRDRAAGRVPYIY